MEENIFEEVLADTCIQVGLNVSNGGLISTHEALMFESRIGKDADN